MPRPAAAVRESGNRAEELASEPGRLPAISPRSRATGEALPEGAQGTFPDTETAWRQYSGAMAWGLVIGWLICVRPLPVAPVLCCSNGTPA